MDGLIMETLTPSTLGNKIWLKPRFKILVDADVSRVKTKFEQDVDQNKAGFRVKIIDNHIVIDVLESDAHFWSPQLQLELIEAGKKTMVKGLFGPKPQLWTFFMMIHFAMAIVFAVFGVLGYSQYTLGKAYVSSLLICLVICVLWIAFYVFGQFGKMKGNAQMTAMAQYIKSVLNFNR
ncbi:hypothetical protein MWU59_01240 [Flavobacteriaceae bacterium F08102]|nr:hypothetical protein [Flavobacteriaceae bacterium F08102]